MVAEFPNVAEFAKIRGFGYIRGFPEVLRLRLRNSIFIKQISQCTTDFLLVYKNPELIQRFAPYTAVDHFANEKVGTQKRRAELRQCVRLTRKPPRSDGVFVGKASVSEANRFMTW